MQELAGLNRALDYVEEHLAGEIDLQVAARLASCSEHHFLRMFSFLAGIPLSEYIRRRRLTLAAFEMQRSSVRVVDAAIKYGYGSPDAFAPAFQAFHGIPPSEAKRSGRPLKAHARLRFHLELQGGEEMNYRIVEKEAFRIVGIKKRVGIQFHGVNPEIEAMWRSLDEATIQRLKAFSNVEPQGLIQASAGFSEGRMEERGGLDHYIGAATTHPCPHGLEALEVPASAWAVFDVVGPFPETLQDVWGRIYSEWFPSFSYELREGPEILWNEHPDIDSPTFRSEIWIPVVRKG